MLRTSPSLPFILLAVLVGGCAGPQHVSSDEFKRQYATVGQPGTMVMSEYLGEREGRASISVMRMSSVSREWSEHVIYVMLSELDPVFRDSLPEHGRMKPLRGRRSE